MCGLKPRSSAHGFLNEVPYYRCMYMPSSFECGDGAITSDHHHWTCLPMYATDHIVLIIGMLINMTSASTCRYPHGFLPSRSSVEFDWSRRLQNLIVLSYVSSLLQYVSRQILSERLFSAWSDGLRQLSGGYVVISARLKVEQQTRLLHQTKWYLSMCHAAFNIFIWW